MLWYESWERSIEGDTPRPTGCSFTNTFLDYYLQQETRYAQVDKFLNLQQGNISVQEYALRFDSFNRYAPAFEDMMQAGVHRFIERLAFDHIEAYTTTPLNDALDII